MNIQKESTMEPYSKQRVSRRLVILLLVVIGSAWFGKTAHAHKIGSCKKCAIFVVISPKGNNYCRDWSGYCRKCYLERDQGWFDINEHRYVYFSDGTMIDMKHFRGSMLLSLAGSHTFGGRLRGIAFANTVGWLIEYNQYRNGHPSGHPDGGNEDLLSNFAGSVFAQTTYSSPSGNNWVQQAVPYLELLYGPVTKVSDSKKEK
jgi:hypothetical protein